MLVSSEGNHDAAHGLFQFWSPAETKLLRASRTSSPCRSFRVAWEQDKRRSVWLRRFPYPSAVFCGRSSPPLPFLRFLFQHRQQFQGKSGSRAVRETAGPCPSRLLHSFPNKVGKSIEMPDSPPFGKNFRRTPFFFVRNRGSAGSRCIVRCVFRHQSCFDWYGRLGSSTGTANNETPRRGQGRLR